MGDTSIYLHGTFFILFWIPNYAQRLNRPYFIQWKLYSMYSHWLSWLDSEDFFIRVISTEQLICAQSQSPLFTGSLHFCPHQRHKARTLFYCLTGSCCYHLEMKKVCSQFVESPFHHWVLFTQTRDGYTVVLTFIKGQFDPLVCCYEWSMSIHLASLLLYKCCYMENLP